jgi:hypothetical protein
MGSQAGDLPTPPTHVTDAFYEPAPTGAAYAAKEGTFRIADSQFT